MKFSNYKKLPPMELELRILLNELCVDLGFCIPADDQTRIVTAEHWNVDEFTNAVLRAEGFNPEHGTQWSRDIRQRFIGKFGDMVSVENYY